MAESSFARRNGEAGARADLSAVDTTEADTRVRVYADIDRADQLDPDCIVEIVVEWFDGREWIRVGSAITAGSVDRPNGQVPFVDLPLPGSRGQVRSYLNVGAKRVRMSAQMLTREVARGIRRQEPRRSVAYDNSAEASGSSLLTLALAGNFTIAGDDRAIIVGVGDRNNGSITAVTAGGLTLTSNSLGTPPTNAGGVRSSMFGDNNPSSGSQTASVTGNGSWSDNSQQVLSVVTLHGVDQTTPFADYNSANGSSNAPSVTVSNVVTGDMVVDCCTHRNLDSTVGANQTERTRELDFSGMSTQAGADGGVMSWASTEALAWATAAVRVVQAAAAPAGIVPILRHHYMMAKR